MDTVQPATTLAPSPRARAGGRGAPAPAALRPGRALRTRPQQAARQARPAARRRSASRLPGPGARAHSPSAPPRRLPRGRPRTYCSLCRRDAGERCDYRGPRPPGRLRPARPRPPSARPGRLRPRKRPPPCDDTESPDARRAATATRRRRPPLPRRAAPLPTFPRFSGSATPKHFLFSFKGRGSRLTSHPSAECFLGIVVSKWSRPLPARPSLFWSLLFQELNFHFPLVAWARSPICSHTGFLLGAPKLCAAPSTGLFPPLLRLLNPDHLSQPQSSVTVSAKLFLSPYPRLNPPLKCCHVSALLPNHAYCIIRSKCCTYFINITFPAQISHLRAGTLSLFAYISLPEPGVS